MDQKIRMIREEIEGEMRRKGEGGGKGGGGGGNSPRGVNRESVKKCRNVVWMNYINILV